jgi:hypothetical protein
MAQCVLDMDTISLLRGQNPTYGGFSTKNFSFSIFVFRFRKLIFEK